MTIFKRKVRHARIWLGLIVASAIGVARADAPVPQNVLNPGTVAEAWNVMRLASANVRQLVNENRLGEIAVQVSLCSPALRTLGNLPPPGASTSDLNARIANATRQIVEVAVAADGQNRPQVQGALSRLEEALADLGRFYEARVVQGEIFVCPMHPDYASENPAVPCHRCGMRLMKRRIPYSFIYRNPGEPTLRLTAKTTAPLAPGERATVRMKLESLSGRPLSRNEFLTVHTEPIHLLIVDASLNDYHHEHPLPVNSRGEAVRPAPAIEGALCGTSPGIPGEYLFTFTPSKPGSYRIFADVVPVDSGVQEYVVVDLPGSGPGGAVGDKVESKSVVSGGLRFDLATPSAPNLPPVARRPQYLKITVSETDGSPCVRLQPVMQAFAHLVGFYEDRETVVHFHPEGGEILKDDARGGPSMSFKIYPPKPGFMRLYCQVMVDGRMIFAPFSLNIAE